MDNLKELKELKEYHKPLDRFKQSFYMLQFMFSNCTAKELLKIEPISVDQKIKELIESLDRIKPFTWHEIAIVYIPKSEDLNEKELYASIETSDLFDKFISQLGNLVNFKGMCENLLTNKFAKPGNDGPYEILWRDELSQIIFHVNTLLQYTGEETKEDRITKVKKVISSTNVAIIWNEYSRYGLSKEVLKQINSKICIVLSPFDDNFWNVTIYQVFCYLFIVQ